MRQDAPDRHDALVAVNDRGDRTRILTPEPVEVTVSGIAWFGDQDSAAGSTSTLFSAEGARMHLSEPIGATGEPGVSSILLTAEDRIFIKDGEKCWFVALKDVRLFESEGNCLLWREIRFGKAR